MKLYDVKQLAGIITFSNNQVAVQFCEMAGLESFGNIGLTHLPENIDWLTAVAHRYRNKWK